MKSKQAYKGLFGILFALLLLISAIMSGRVTLPAFAAETGYTGALEDLQKDENFNVSVYPDNESDYKNSDFAKKVDSFYSIHVIQIAESTGGELFIYTYQPCQKTRYLVATEINMSLTDKMGGEVAEDEELSPADSSKLYGLTLLSCDGVLCKYKVNDFTVNEDETRYYNIASIYREWIKGVDKDTGNDNELLKISFPVGRLWKVFVDDNGINYSTVETEVVVIENARNGVVRYAGGLLPGSLLGSGDIDSHYVAFSSDHEIDELLSADIYYTYRDVHHRVPLAASDKYSYGDELSNKVTLKPDEVTVQNHFKKRKWNRIERVSDFIKNEDLTQEAKDQLNGLEWILRFFESDYDCFQDVAFDEWYTEVTSCTILRLEFEFEGKRYNLGAVDNLRKPPVDKLDNNVNAVIGKGDIPWWVYLVVALAVLFVLLPLLLAVIFPTCANLLVKVLKGVWWLISAPFRLLVILFGKMKK